MWVAKLQYGAKIPTKKHPDDAGWDLYTTATKVISAHTIETIPTGITLEIPKNVVGIIKPKGGSNYLIGAGVIDAGYQGEILVKVANVSPKTIVLSRGVAFAQIVFIPIYDAGAELDEVSEDEIHTEKSLRSATGGIHTVKSTPEIIGDGTIGLETDKEGNLVYKGWD